MRLPSIALIAFAAAAPATAQTASYRAQGDGWSMTIDRSGIRIARPGMPLFVESLTNPDRAARISGHLSETMLLDIEDIPCSDGESDRIWPDTVFLRVHDLAYRGCGGDPVTSPATAAMLQGQWRVAGLHGRRVAPDTRPIIRFAGDQVSGNASCNDFATSFRFDDDRLRLAPIAAMAHFCDKRVQNVQEGSIRDFLATPLRASDLGGRLVLANDKGETMLLLRYPAR